MDHSILVDWISPITAHIVAAYVAFLKVNKNKFVAHHEKSFDFLMKLFVWGALVALSIAGYQMQQERGSEYVAMIVTHHALALAWAGLVMDSFVKLRNDEVDGMPFIEKFFSIPAYWYLTILRYTCDAAYSLVRYRSLPDNPIAQKSNWPEYKP